LKRDALRDQQFPSPRLGIPSNNRGGHTPTATPKCSPPPISLTLLNLGMWGGEDEEISTWFYTPCGGNEKRCQSYNPQRTGPPFLTTKHVPQGGEHRIPNVLKKKKQRRGGANGPSLSSLHKGGEGNPAYKKDKN